MRWDKKLTDCSHMLDSLYYIIDFDFSNFDTFEVVDMSYMFSNLDNIKVMDLSNFNTSSVTNIYYMIYTCQLLVSLS